VNHAARHAKETAVFDIVKNTVGLKHMSSANQNAEARRRVANRTFFGSLTFVSLIARKD
jgi:hypothetical protein